MNRVVKTLFVATAAGALLISVGAALAGNGDGQAKAARCDDCSSASPPSAALASTS
jgi:hypothetical protein